MNADLEVVGDNVRCAISTLVGNERKRAAIRVFWPQKATVGYLFTIKVSLLHLPSCHRLSAKSRQLAEMRREATGSKVRLIFCR